MGNKPFYLQSFVSRKETHILLKLCVNISTAIHMVEKTQKNASAYHECAVFTFWQASLDGHTDIVNLVYENKAYL